MIKRINDGGPAFPVECYWQEDAPMQGVQTGNSQGFAMGLTIRDYFAAKAMQELVRRGIPMFDTDMPGVAAMAYRMADSMLDAREVTK